MSGKKEEQKGRAHESEGSYEIEEDLSDEDIEDDGTSIDIQERSRASTPPSTSRST